MKREEKTKRKPSLGSHIVPIIKNKDSEKSVWEAQIRPILKRYNLDLDYKFKAGSFTEVDVLKATQFAVQFCNGLPYRDIFMLMRDLRSGIEEVPGFGGKPINLKNLFIRFYNELIETGTEAHFLELLTREPIVNYKERGNKKLRPSQKHRYVCREVAEKLWQSNPELTITQIANRNEIVNACDGKKYTEKTIRKWIKDLNPNPSPGRRKGT